MSGGNLLRTFRWVSSVLIVAILLTFVSLYTLTRPSLQVVKAWQQPATIVNEETTYYLSVVKSDRDWRGFPFNMPRRYGIYVGRERDQPTYGHWLDFSFYPFPDSTIDHIRKSIVEWTPSGVTFAPPSGHRLFIPRTMFSGGR